MGHDEALELRNCMAKESRKKVAEAKFQSCHWQEAYDQLRQRNLDEFVTLTSQLCTAEDRAREHAHVLDLRKQDETALEQRRSELSEALFGLASAEAFFAEDQGTEPDEEDSGSTFSATLARCECPPDPETRGPRPTPATNVVAKRLRQDPRVPP